MKEITQSTKAGEVLPSAIASIDRRTLLKLTGAAALTSGFASGTVAADHGCSSFVEAEIEGTLDEVSTSGDREITVMGIPARVAEGPINSPTSSLTFGDLRGSRFPERDEFGFIGGTAAGIGRVCIDDIGEAGFETTAAHFVIDELFVEVAEHVVFGPVTQNDFDEGEDFENHSGSKQFRVQGANVRPVGDSRMPFTATHADLNSEVDVGSLEVGSLVSVEGYMGNQGTLYVHTLEAEEGSITENIALNITRAECRDEKDIRVEGTVSETDGTVTLEVKPEGGEWVLYTEENVTPSDAEDVGQFQFDYDNDDEDISHLENGIQCGLVRVTYFYPDDEEASAQATAEPQ